jgi:hypothetical protein
VFLELKDDGIRRHVVIRGFRWRPGDAIGLKAGTACCVQGIALLVLALPWSAAGAATRHEQEPVLDSAELVAPSLLHGPGFAVEARAPVVGYQARFTLRTRYGVLTANSVEMLAIRVAEMPAVEMLHAQPITSLMSKAASERMQEGTRSLAGIARRPLRTLANLPRGVARYFGKRLEKIGNRAQKLGDRARRRITEDGNPYDDARGVMSATRERTSEPRHWYDKPRRELRNLARGELDHAGARREWARRLGVDPETSNPLIIPRLDALAWAAVGAQQATTLALANWGGGISTALAQGSRIHDAAWSLEPQDLRARNRARISTWCQDERLLRRFLHHRPFSAQLQTALSEALRSLQPAQGCSALLETALMARNEQEARFVVNAISLLRHQLGSTEQGGQFVPIGAAIAYRSSDGHLLLPLPVDLLSWSHQVEQLFDLRIMRTTSRTVLVTGSISMRAQRELTARGWNLIASLPYPDAPPYALSPARPVSR